MLSSASAGGTLEVETSHFVLSGAFGTGCSTICVVVLLACFILNKSLLSQVLFAAMPKY